jgi:hypothetical protein
MNCSIDECGRDARGRGLCPLHYQRHAKAGTLPDLPKRAAVAFDELAAIETDDCVIWPHGKVTGGYGLVVINGVRHYVHVEACRRGNGPMPAPGMDAAHSCGVRACMNHRHLRWATRAENEADKQMHGTYHMRGPKPSKLTDEQVDAIRLTYEPGVVTQRELADRYGVTEQYVGQIINGRKRR